MNHKLDEGKTKFIVRDAKEEEQKKGADFFIINNELGCRYVEVKLTPGRRRQGM